VKRAATAALPLAVLLTLAGCASEGGDAGNASSTSAPSASAHDEAHDHSKATVAPVPEAGSDSQADAITAAEDVVTAFGRPDLPYEEWIGGLYPLLTPVGAAAYEDTDPANVPVHQVTGAGTILPESTDVALIVQVPTDAGPYNVSLSRADASAPWLADRIRPAEG
jgi:hypothetical protein